MKGNIISLLKMQYDIIAENDEEFTEEGIKKAIELIMCKPWFWNELDNLLIDVYNVANGKD